MLPALGAILRTLIGSGAAAARPAVAATVRGGVRTAARGTGWVERTMQRFTRPTAPAPTGAAATRPKVDYSQMLSNMGDSQAYQNATTPPDPPPPRPTVGGAVKGMASAIGEGTGLSDTFRGLKKLISGDVMGAVKDFGKGILKAATGLVGVPLALDRWVRSVVESRRELARYNGAIATAFSKLDAQTVQNQIRTAQGTQGSTGAAVDASAELQNLTRPIHQDIATATNSLAWIGAKLGSFGASLYPAFRTLLGFGPILDAIERNTREKNDNKLPMARGFLQQLQNGQHAAGGVRPPLPPIR